MRNEVFLTPDPFGLPELPRSLPYPFERPVWRDWRWGAAEIKILIVTDNSTYSETDPFGLGIVLKDAFDSDHPDHPDYARFTFTKAHREDPSSSSDVSAGFSNFRFVTGSLDAFDELWLFGVNRGAPYLSSQEVTVVEAFMDAGGGVLAMGDHEDLGLGLCGGIKRVRSMRKWWFESPAPPANMLKAPHVSDLTRNDTVQAPTLGGDVNTGRQDDGTPQSILINYQYGSVYSRPWLRARYPHPVLCGPRGAIKVLPDHAHEGDCIIPDPAFANEYPGGVPVEIIARGQNVVGRIKRGGNQIVDPREFGILGVWDGHLPAADKGRVLVDATWHHWFNVNLFGLRAENGLEYADILAYYRNVATWLAPTDAQNRMRQAGQLVFMLTPSFVETALTLHELRPDQFWQIGTLARDSLGKIAPQCQSSRWLIDFVRPHLSARLVERIESGAFEKAGNRFEALALDKLVTTIFGGVTNVVAVAMNEQKSKCDLRALCGRIDELAKAGGEAAANYAVEDIRKEISVFAKEFVDVCSE